jgi:hypothetical protein
MGVYYGLGNIARVRRSEARKPLIYRLFPLVTVIKAGGCRVLVT